VKEVWQQTKKVILIPIYGWSSLFCDMFGEAICQDFELAK
jgi:hypothetical protein